VRLLRLYEGTSEIQRLIIGGGLIRAQQRRLRAVRERRQLVRLGGGGLVVAGAAGRYGDSRSAIQPVPRRR
jgi:hypothetical protein